ncbi:hypothetical protein [Aquiflexum sp.]|uniref:carboxylesterase family protein n=1 Tax=Aquiflexum sp. TaxID=1872584 RepID=UPI0035941128
MKNRLALYLIFFLPFFLSAQVEFEKHIFHDATTELPYRLLQPKNFDSNQKYPLLLFLHGAGERGNDNEIQLVHRVDLFLKAIQSDQYPSFMHFPQCPKHEEANPRLSLYPDVNHNSWDNAFAEPDFLEWIFSQKK